MAAFIYLFILRYQLLKCKKRKSILMLLKNGGSVTQKSKPKFKKKEKN
jgi:hypothetical protein